MTLKAILESLDGLSDALKAEYVEGEGDNAGKFFLQVEDDIKTHPKVKNLQSALERQKADNGKLKTENAALKVKAEGLPDDFTVEEYERLKAELDGGKKKPDERVTELRQQLETKHGREKEALQKRIDFLEKAARNLAVEDALTAAIIKAGIEPKHMKAVRSLLREEAKVKIEEDAEKGRINALVETDMGDYTFEKFVAEWATTDEGKPYVAKASGGGANGGTGPGKSAKNPWRKAPEWNLTEQNRIARENPQEAARLAAEAGVPVIPGQQQLAS